MIEAKTLGSLDMYEQRQGNRPIPHEAATTQTHAMETILVVVSGNSVLVAIIPERAGFLPALEAPAFSNWNVDIFTILVRRSKMASGLESSKGVDK